MFPKLPPKIEASSRKKTEKETEQRCCEGRAHLSLMDMCRAVMSSSSSGPGRGQALPAHADGPEAESKRAVNTETGITKCSI